MKELLGSLQLNRIYQMDCTEGMKLIPDESVDLLLTDPPYNVSQKSNFHTMGRKGVDFGEWDKEFNQQDWLEIACGKVKKGGSAIIFNDYKNQERLRETDNEEVKILLNELIYKIADGQFNIEVW